MAATAVLLLTHIYFQMLILKNEPHLATAFGRQCDEASRYRLCSDMGTGHVGSSRWTMDQCRSTYNYQRLCYYFRMSMVREKMLKINVALYPGGGCADLCCRDSESKDVTWYFVLDTCECSVVAVLEENMPFSGSAEQYKLCNIKARNGEEFAKLALTDSLLCRTEFQNCTPASNVSTEIYTTNTYATTDTKKTMDTRKTRRPSEIPPSESTNTILLISIIFALLGLLTLFGGFYLVSVHHPKSPKTLILPPTPIPYRFAPYPNTANFPSYAYTLPSPSPPKSFKSPTFFSQSLGVSGSLHSKKELSRRMATSIKSPVNPASKASSHSSSRETTSPPGTRTSEPRRMKK